MTKKTECIKCKNYLFPGAITCEAFSKYPEETGKLLPLMDVPFADEIRSLIANGKADKNTPLQFHCFINPKTGFFVKAMELINDGHCKYYEKRTLLYNIKRNYKKWKAQKIGLLY
jgi:hypothetical protein